MSTQDRPIAKHKLRLARHAAAKHGVKSFADLGGCWGVHGGYTTGLLDGAEIERAYLVDGKITEESRERGANFRQLSFIQGLMSESTVLDQVDSVDMLLMFDILLHQVDPNWDQFIELWAPKARVIVVYNQMWEKGDTTVRFVDQGAEWYKTYVHRTKAADVDAWFSKHDQIHPQMKKPWRDVHYFWQFGITRGDLVERFQALAFRLDLFENFGAWTKDLPWIQNEGFVFVRRG